MLSRLRAVLTPHALIFLTSLLIGALLIVNGADSGGETELEKRIAATLSAMEGAGEVRVVIASREVQTAGIGMQGRQMQQVPSGAVVVAQGANDPWIQAQLTQAVCALLGLPASAVNVISGGE